MKDCTALKNGTRICNYPVLYPIYRFYNIKCEKTPNFTGLNTFFFREIINYLTTLKTQKMK